MTYVWEGKNIVLPSTSFPFDLAIDRYTGIHKACEILM